MLPDVSTPLVIILSAIVAAAFAALFWLLFVSHSGGVNHLEDNTYSFKVKPTGTGHARVILMPLAPRAIAAAPLQLTATRDPDNTVGVLLAGRDGRLRFPTTCDNCRDNNHRQHVLSNGMCYVEWCACPPRTVWR